MAAVRTNRKWYTGIANAIRTKSGSTARYTPAQLAAAVQALPCYGTLASPPEPDYSGGAETPAMTDSAHYGAIADAIRTKNGSAVRYPPGQMAQAILAFDTAVPTFILIILVKAGYEGFTKIELYRGRWTELLGTYTPADMNNKNHIHAGIRPYGVYSLRMYYGSQIFEAKDYDVDNGPNAEHYLTIPKS